MYIRTFEDISCINLNTHQLFINYFNIYITLWRIYILYPISMIKSKKYKHQRCLENLTVNCIWFSRYIHKWIEKKLYFGISIKWLCKQWIRNTIGNNRIHIWKRVNVLNSSMFLIRQNTDSLYYLMGWNTHSVQFAIDLLFLLYFKSLRLVVTQQWIGKYIWNVEKRI